MEILVKGLTMTTAENKLNLLSEKLNLGHINKPIVNIPGGPGGENLLWKITTEKGAYCIKELPASTNLNDGKTIARYNLCESIASRFARHGIPVVYAIKYHEDYIHVIENHAYLVFPWIEGYIQKNFSETHAIKIAEVLANIHKLNLETPDIQQKFDKFTNDSIMEAINQALALDLPFAAQIKENTSMIFALNDIYQNSIPVLSETCVLTHGDVNKTNVLWNEKDEPFLIDWESVKKMNPTQEIVRSTLGWGVPEKVSYETMLAMISAYKKSGGLFNVNHAEAALNSLFGNQIFWLMHNLKIALNDTSRVENTKVSHEINEVLISMKKISDKIPDLISVLKSH